MTAKKRWCRIASVASLVMVLDTVASAGNTYHLTDLGTLGGADSRAYDINDAGQVVGMAYVNGNHWHAFRYNDGQLEDLGTLGGDYSIAYAINASGQVVGQSSTGTHGKGFFSGGGAMQELGTFGGGGSYASGINTGGQVVGFAYTIDNDERAFVWNSTLGGGLQNLGTLGGRDSRAYDINDSGQIVGTASSTTSSQRPFLYENGVMKDLGTFGGSKVSRWTSTTPGRSSVGLTPARPSSTHFSTTTASCRISARSAGRRALP